VFLLDWKTIIESNQKLPIKKNLLFDKLLFVDKTHCNLQAKKQARHTLQWVRFGGGGGN